VKQESKRDIVKRLRESLTAQQRSVPQLPAQAQARKIKVLGAKTDPQHPFAGYAVGADESAEPGKKTIGPDKNDPYNQGWFASFNDQNPYAAGTPEHSQWQAGQDEKQAQPNHYDESALSEFAPGPGRDGDDDDNGDNDYNSGNDKINTTANAIVKLLKSRQPVYFQSPDGRVSQIRKISPLNVSPINQDADGNIIGTAAFDIVSKSAGGRNYLDQVAIQPEMYGIVPVLGKKIVMQVADQNLPPHLKRMRDDDGDLTEADFDPGRRGFLKKAGAVAATAAMPTGLAGAAAKAIAPAASWASTLSAPLAGLTAVDLDDIINLLMSSKPESMISGKDPYDLDIMKSIAQDAARESWGNPWMKGNAAKAFLDAVELGKKKGMDGEDIIQDLFIVTKKQYMQELKKLSPEEVAKVKSQSLNPDNKSEPAASPTTGMSGLARAAGAQIGRTATKLGKATATTVLNQPARDMGRIEPTTAPTALPAPTASTGMQIPKQKSRVAANQDKELGEADEPAMPSRRDFLKASVVAAILSSTPVAKLMSNAPGKMSIVKHRGNLGKYQSSDIDSTGYDIGKKQFYITVDGKPYTMQTGIGAGFMGQDFKNSDFESDPYLQKIAPWLDTKDEYILQIADYDIELYDQNNQKIFPVKDQQQMKEMYSSGLIDAIIGFSDVYQTDAIQQMAKVPNKSNYPVDQGDRSTDSKSARPTTGMSGLARAAGAQLGRTMKNVGKATANTVLNQPAKSAALPAPSVSPSMQIPKQKSRVDASPFNDDHSELDQFVKEEFNRHPDDINEESGVVIAHGYAYNRQDQRVAWTREFASEAAAKEWARRRNATVLSIVPKDSIEEDWKRKLAGAAIAGAAAFGGGGAQAQTTAPTGVNATGNNAAIVQSLVNPVAQQRFAAQHADTTSKLTDPKYTHNPNALAQHQAAPKQQHDEWIQNVRNAAQFENPYQIIRIALNMAGVTPQEVLQNLPQGYKLPTTEPKTAPVRLPGDPGYVREGAGTVGGNNPAAAWPDFGTAKTYESQLAEAKQRLAEGKPQKRADRYHINKDGKPASLASYADKSSAVKDRDARYPDAKVHQVGPRGKVKGEFEEGMAEGARVDRMVRHIASSEKATGKSNKDAESIAWATVNKRGYLDNKNKKKHVAEAGTPADIRAKNRAVVKKIQGKEADIDEGLKRKLAGAVLAGAAALGGGAAAAHDHGDYGHYDQRVDDRSWDTSGYDDHIKSDTKLTKTTTPDGKVSRDSQHRISSVQGPNAQGEYRVFVGQNGKIVSSYITKTPPQDWMVKEDITQEDIITKLKAKLGDYLSDLGQQIKKDPALQDKLSAKPPGDQVGPPVKTLTTDDGHEISIHGNEDDGFRISIKNRQTPSKFDSLDEAVMACEMYRAHRRRQELTADYVEEA
jgi:hypothetical protein